MKFLNKLIATVFVISTLYGLSYAITCGGSSEPYFREEIGGVEYYCLDRDGNITSSGTFVSKGRIQTSSSTVSAGGFKIGNHVSAPTSSPTAGSGGTGVDFGVKVPFVNATDSAIAAGAVVLASATTNVSVIAPGTVAAVTSTTTWVGINEKSLASGATGYMTVSGYALVLTSGTVTVGDVVVSSANASGAGGGSAGVGGYAGRIAADGNTVVGTVIGKAMSQGTAAGGLTLIRLGN